MAVFGYVTDDNGNPIADLKIHATYVDRRLRRSYDNFQGTTDARGFYQIDGFSAEGNRKVEIYAGGRDGPYISQRRVSVPGNTEDFVLQMRPMLLGKVVSKESRKPLTSIQTGILYPAHGDSQIQFALNDGMDVIDGEGNFQVTLPKEGNFRLVLRSAGYAMEIFELSPVFAGEVLDGLTFELTPQVSRDGIVVDRLGAPIANATIYLGFPMSIGSNGMTTSRPDGRFRVDGLSPQIQVLSVSHSDYAPGWAYLDSDAFATSIPRIVLSEGGEVEGTIFVDGESVGRSEGVVWTLLPDGTDPPTASAMTDDDGHYRREKVNPGDVRLRAQAQGVGYMLERDVFISDRTTVHANFQFSSTSEVALSGQVLLDGNAVGGGHLEASAPLHSGDNAFFFIGLDSDGSYLIEDIPEEVSTLDATIVVNQSSSPPLFAGFVIEVPTEGAESHDILLSIE